MPDRATGVVQHRLPLVLDPSRLKDDLAAVETYERLRQTRAESRRRVDRHQRAIGGRATSAAPCFPSLDDYALTEAAGSAPYITSVLQGLPFELHVVRLLQLTPGGNHPRAFRFLRELPIRPLYGYTCQS
jgi:hypothetical protein